MKKTIIVMMMVLLSLVLLVVSCDDKFTTDQSDNNENTSGNGGNESGNGGNAGGAEVLPTDIKVGDEVKIGTVIWKALAVDDENDRALVISRDILERKAFDDTSNAYESSDIRSYLNNTTDEEGFFKTYGLSASYMKRVNVTTNIEITTIDDTTGTDYVFLLSQTEVDESVDGSPKYFTSDSERIANYSGSSTTVSWWLRTPYGTDGKSSYYIAADGDVVIGGKYDDDKGARPAFWYAWAETEYKITYTIGDGANAADGNPSSYTRFEDTTKNEAVTISKAPTKDGYTFKGWKLKGTEDSTAKTPYTMLASG